MTCSNSEHIILNLCRNTGKLDKKCNLFGVAELMYHELGTPNNVLKIIVEQIGQPEVNRDLFEIVAERRHVERHSRDVGVVEAALK